MFTPNPPPRGAKADVSAKKGVNRCTFRGGEAGRKYGPELHRDLASVRTESGKYVGGPAKAKYGRLNPRMLLGRSESTSSGIHGWGDQKERELLSRLALIANVDVPKALSVVHIKH